MTTRLISFYAIMYERFYSVISKEIATESFAVTDMTAATGVVLFRSGSEGSGFHANERPKKNSEI